MRKITKRSIMGYQADSVRHVLAHIQSQHEDNKKQLEQELIDLKIENNKLWAKKNAMNEVKKAKEETT